MTRSGPAKKVNEVFQSMGRNFLIYLVRLASWLGDPARTTLRLDRAVVCVSYYIYGARQHRADKADTYGFTGDAHEAAEGLAVGRRFRNGPLRCYLHHGHGVAAQRAVALVVDR